MPSSSIMVVVLSYNSVADTLACLASLKAQDYDKLHVLVVDNASADGAPERISEAYPDIELIALPENLGWAGGNNVGIRCALQRGFDLVCLLNNDTVLAPACIERLCRTAEALGPAILHPAIDFADPEGTPQLDPSVDVPRPIRVVQDGIYEVDWAYGACMVIHWNILRQVGLLDERFFLQLEETDIYRRARKAGYGSFVDTKTRIIHKESASYGAKRRPIKTYYIMRNSLLLVEKHDLSFSAYLRTLQQFYWILKITSREESGTRSGIFSFLMWLVSRDLFAVAARMALHDYLFRRFGRIGERGFEILSGPIEERSS